VAVQFFSLKRQAYQFKQDFIWSVVNPHNISKIPVKRSTFIFKIENQSNLNGWDCPNRATKWCLVDFSLRLKQESKLSVGAQLQSAESRRRLAEWKSPFRRRKIEFQLKWKKDCRVTRWFLTKRLANFSQKDVKYVEAFCYTRNFHLNQKWSKRARLKE